MNGSIARPPIAALALLVLLAVCRYEPTPVLLQGGPGDIASLAGSWEGEYFGTESGRSGTIMFTVQAGKDTAYGDVLMETAPGHPITAADVTSGAHAVHAHAPGVLRITFVNVHGGLVEGVLEPYIAPDCDCVVSTTFRGGLQSDVVKGEYVTTGRYGLRQTGKWSVRRKRAT